MAGILSYKEVYLKPPFSFFSIKGMEVREEISFSR
jgi:hypothetical protein